MDTPTEIALSLVLLLGQMVVELVGPDDLAFGLAFRTIPLSRLPGRARSHFPVNVCAPLFPPRMYRLYKLRLYRVLIASLSDVDQNRNDRRGIIIIHRDTLFERTVLTYSVR